MPRLDSLSSLLPGCALAFFVACTPVEPALAQEERDALLGSIGLLSAELEVEESATFAGSWVEYEPRFGAVALFTRDGEATIRRHSADPRVAGRIEVRTAEFSLAALMAAQAAVDAELRAIGVVVDSGVDVKRNRVVLYVADPLAFAAMLAGRSVTLPREVIVQAGDPMVPSM